MDRGLFVKVNTRISAGIVGAAAVAMTVSGLADPAVSVAELNTKSFNSCAAAADKRWVAGQTNDATHLDELKFCCIRAGGQYDLATSACVEKPATAQTASKPLPSRVATGPGQATLPGTRAD